MVGRCIQCMSATPLVATVWRGFPNRKSVGTNNKRALAIPAPRDYGTAIESDRLHSNGQQMRIISKFLWLTHVPRLLNIGAHGSSISLRKIKLISLAMWSISLSLVAFDAMILCFGTRYFSATSFFCIVVFPSSIFWLITYFSNGFYSGSLFFKVSGARLNVHDWKVETGKKSGALVKDFFACFDQVSKSGASSIVIKSHIFGKFDDAALKNLMERKIKRFGFKNLTYEILPHTRIKPWDRMLMFMMGIKKRSPFESGFKLILKPTIASANTKI